MAWPGSKHLLKAKRNTSKRKIKMESWGLGISLKDRPIVPIEEIRRQGLVLAGRSLGQGVRSRPMAQSDRRGASGRPAEIIAPSRRGATR